MVSRYRYWVWQVTVVSVTNPSQSLNLRVFVRTCTVALRTRLSKLILLELPEMLRKEAMAFLLARRQAQCYVLSSYYLPCLAISPSGCLGIPHSCRI